MKTYSKPNKSFRLKFLILLSAIEFDLSHVLVSSFYQLHWSVAKYIQKLLLQCNIGSIMDNWKNGISNS